MALSQYEIAINKAKAEKAEKEILDKTKPQMEEIEARLDRIRNQEKKHLEYVVTHQSSNGLNLITCTKCGNSISKRADKCPKCNNAVLITCGICSKEIPKSSIECPICGDPHPFDVSITLKQHCHRHIKTQGDKIFGIFGLLRLIRGLFGFIAAWQVLGLLPILSWLQDLGAVDGNMTAILVAKLLFMAISFGAFFGLRALINKLHIKRHGIQHPSLVKTWAL